MANSGGVVLTPTPTSPVGGSGTVSDDMYEALCVAVPLWRYAEYLTYAPCQFFGVRNEESYVDWQCRDIWTQDQRDYARYYLDEAQEEIEDELNFFLCRKWVYGTMGEVPTGDYRYVDAPQYHIPMNTKWGMVHAGGTMGISYINKNASVSHVADPAVIGPVATTVTDPDEVRVFHPGSNLEIYPSKKTISSGSLTIEIPRCRMVKESLMDNPIDGLDYTDTSNFESLVDVYRIYNDASENATLVTPHSCTDSCGVSGCSEYTQTGCIYVRDYEMGKIDIVPSTYSGGSWSRTGGVCCSPSLSRLYYYAGLIKPTKVLEEAVIRLAHAKMPDEPCGCDLATRLWKRDRHIPSPMTERRADNPFGISDGAWRAWMLVNRYKNRQMYAWA